MQEQVPATCAVMVMTEGITPYVKNPKKHPEAQIAKIAEQIKAVGFDQPIVVDKDMVIIKGHGRWLAAKSLGLKKVPVVIHDKLSKAKARAIRIADNKVAESDWDYDALKDEFIELADAIIRIIEVRDSDVDILLTGFDADEAEKLMESTEPDVDDNDEETHTGKGKVHTCPDCGCEFED